ncbi:alpha/beta fold hydrolase [Marinobacter sp. SS13-12]|uniref:alpha/beta fold hydrolase n=1 Tax=Marinobacter sp. SS13-12 TaxID=3050451 RepID=UPI0033077085
MQLSDPKQQQTSRGRFAWREGGDPEDQPLVMIHGWPESSYCWEHVAAHLKPGFRIIAPDGDHEHCHHQQSERQPGSDRESSRR